MTKMEDDEIMEISPKEEQYRIHYKYHERKSKSSKTRLQVTAKESHNKPSSHFLRKQHGSTVATARTATATTTKATAVSRRETTTTRTTTKTAPSCEESSSYVMEKNHDSNSICNNTAITAALYLLSVLTYKVKMFTRHLIRCSNISSSVSRLYQGLVVMYLICVIDGQNSTPSVEPSSSVSTSLFTSLSYSETTNIVNSGITPNMNSSIHLTPSMTSAVTMYNVYTSIVPSTTKSLPTHTPSTGSDVNLNTSEIDVNMKSSRIEMTSSSVNMTSSTSVVNAAPSTIATNMTSSYDVPSPSAGNNTMAITPSSLQTLSSVSSSYELNGTSSVVVMSSASSSSVHQSVNLTSSLSPTRESSTLSVHESTSSTSVYLINSTHSSFESQPTSSALNITSTSTAMPHINTTTPLSAYSSVSPSTSRPNTVYLINSTSSSFESQPTSSALNITLTSTAMPHINTTTPLSVYSSVTPSTSYSIATSASVHVNASSTPTLNSVRTTSYTDSSSVALQINSTTANSTFSSMTLSTRYINASSAELQINSTTANSTFSSMTLSTRYINASSVALRINSITANSTFSSMTLSTGYINASSAVLQINSTTANSTFSSMTLSTRYINATSTVIVTPSNTIMNGSSVMSILPSTPWPMNYSSTYWSTPTWSYNVSLTSSVNHSTITPSSTMMVMNASSSSSLPGPTPIPDQGLRTCRVDVTILNEQFTPELNQKNSTAYKNLVSKVTNAFEGMFSPLPGFLGVTVERFTQGSVVVLMKANFNATSNVTTAQIEDTITAHNATNNTQNFIFSQDLGVRDECTPGFCVNGGPCQMNATVGAFCRCPSGFTGVRCDKVIVNGGFGSWSVFSECSKSCKGGKTHRTRTCTNPPPQNDGRDCSSLGPSYEEKDCNSDVLCPVIWVIIGICCLIFLLLLILLIVCCIKRRKKEREESSTTGTTGSQMNIVPLEIMVYEEGHPKGRRSPDGISNPEFINESETEEDDIYKKQLLLFLKQSHLIKPGMNLSYGDDISDTSDYTNTNSRKVSAISIDSDEIDQNEKQPKTSEL